MKCMVRAGLVAATLACACPATAQAQKQFGAANVLCSQYTKAARTSDIVYHQASNWLLGYVSGMNAAMAVVERGRGGQPDQRPGAEIGDRLLHGESRRDHRRRRGPVVRAMPKQAEPPPQQAQSPAPSKDDNWIKLNLEAPARKPLLDRR